MSFSVITSHNGLLSNPSSTPVSAASSPTRTKRASLEPVAKHVLFNPRVILLSEACIILSCLSVFVRNSLCVRKYSAPRKLSFYTRCSLNKNVQSSGLNLVSQLKKFRCYVVNWI